jgi:hypothetical protein
MQRYPRYDQVQDHQSEHGRGIQFRYETRIFHDDKNFADDGARQITYDALKPFPKDGTLYQTAKGTTHNFKTTVNTCSNINGFNTFFMKVKLKPTDNAINTTSKCGTNESVIFNRFRADAKPDFDVAQDGTTKSSSASKAPSVKKSKAPSTKMSKAPTVKTTKAPSVKMSKAPSVKTSKYVRVKTKQG